MQFSKELRVNLTTLVGLVKAEWKSINPRQKESLTLNACRALQMFTDDKACVSRISQEFPGFMTSLANLVDEREDNPLV